MILYKTIYYTEPVIFLPFTSPCHIFPTNRPTSTPQSPLHQGCFSKENLLQPRVAVDGGGGRRRGLRRGSSGEQGEALVSRVDLTYPSCCRRSDLRDQLVNEYPLVWCGRSLGSGSGGGAVAVVLSLCCCKNAAQYVDVDILPCLLDPGGKLDVCVARQGLQSFHDLHSQRHEVVLECLCDRGRVRETRVREEQERCRVGPALRGVLKEAKHRGDLARDLH